MRTRHTQGQRFATAGLDTSPWQRRPGGVRQAEEIPLLRGLARPRGGQYAPRWFRASATLEAAPARSHRTAPGRPGARAGGREEHEQRRRSPSARARESGGRGVTASPLAVPARVVGALRLPRPRRITRAAPVPCQRHFRASVVRTGTARTAGPARTRGRRRRPRAAPPGPPCTCTGVWRTRRDRPAACARARVRVRGVRPRGARREKPAREARFETPLHGRRVPSLAAKPARRACFVPARLSSRGAQGHRPRAGPARRGRRANASQESIFARLFPGATVSNWRCHA